MLYYYLSFYFVLAPVHTHTQTISTHTHARAHSQTETTPRDFLLTPSSPRVLGPDVRNDLSAIVQQDLAALRNAADVLSHFSPVCSPSFSLFLISGANLLDQLSSLPPLPLCACVRAWMWVLAQPGADIIYNLMHNLSIHPSIHHSHSYFLLTCSCRCVSFSLFVDQSVIYSLFIYFSTSVCRTSTPPRCISVPHSLLHFELWCGVCGLWCDGGRQTRSVAQCRAWSWRQKHQPAIHTSACVRGQRATNNNKNKNKDKRKINFSHYSWNLSSVVMNRKQLPELKQTSRLWLLWKWRLFLFNVKNSVSQWPEV